jgi:membrane protein
VTTDQLREIGTRMADHVRDDDVPGLATQLAYRFLFAVFPFGLFVAALGAFVAGWAGIDNPAERIVDALGDNLPPDLASTVRPELEQVINETRPALLSVGALGAVWAATGGTNTLIKAMNRAYDVEETRPFVFRYLVAAGLTILAGIGILVSFVTIVGSALLTQEAAERLGVSDQAYVILDLARWPVVFLLLVAATALMFRVAPNIKVAWRWALAGGIAFAIGWLIATWAFAFWVGTFGNYGAMYGSLGSVIVLMIWFYLTGLLLVGAAQLVAATASVLDPGAVEEARRAAQEEHNALLATARDAAGAAEDRVRSMATDDDDDGGTPSNDRRTGPPDRRRRSLRPARQV